MRCGALTGQTGCGQRLRREMSSSRRAHIGQDTHSLTDDELVARLTQVRGIGPWTVHILNGVTERRSIKGKVGVWIHHREAILVVVVREYYR